jgi:16S rRNA (cytidine1402-2'-O)-methyltransferase
MPRIPCRPRARCTLQARRVERRILLFAPRACWVIAVPGTLYIVATPIGNLGDITERARQVLGRVAVVAAEDTRHTGQLLAQYGLSVSLIALHEHNEADRADQIVARLVAGDDVALVSDAGTPLVSDPGYRLVSAAADAGIQIVPLPGPCAAIAALSVAGLPTDRFAFEGFLPHKAAARRSRLAELALESRTMVFYESPHRIKETLSDLAAAFGDSRAVVMARELTKLHETVYRASLAGLLLLAQTDANIARGECVLIVAGHEAAPADEDVARYDGALMRLLDHAPAAVITDSVAEITGLRRNAVYERVLMLRKQRDELT